MTATYNPAQIDPATGTAISAVRFLLQDTDTSAAELDDAEITAVYAGFQADLTQQVRVFLSAARLAETLWIRYSKQASFSAEGVSVELGKRAELWRKTADYLAGLAALSTGSDGCSVTYQSRPATF